MNKNLVKILEAGSEPPKTPMDSILDLETLEKFADEVGMPLSDPLIDFAYKVVHFIKSKYQFHFPPNML